MILQMDNLVRLTFRDNPGRGDSRSLQVCTLPITIKGLPCDAESTQKWHIPTICNGNINCPCKTSIPLNMNNMENTLLNALEEEDMVARRFCQLSTWSHGHIWKEIIGTSESLLIKYNITMQFIGIVIV